MKSITKDICLVVCCIVLIVGGLLLTFRWSIIFNCILSIQCNPLSYKTWRNIPFDVPTEFYFFNWTNPEHLYDTSVKPKFKEVGPYTFLQKEEKCNIVWNDNGTVTYQQRRFWFYDTTKENGNLEDKITTVNPTLLGIAYVTRAWKYFARKSLFLVLSPFLLKIDKTHQASEFLFNGYPEPLIKIARSMPFFAHLKLPAWDRFGWMYDRNGSSTYDGIFNMGTGSDSVLGNIYRWNHSSRTEHFDGQCGKIFGSAGQFFPQNLGQEPIEIFSPDLGRHFSLEFAEKIKVNNILGHKYIATSRTYDNGMLEPEHKCFCRGECIPSGVVNISSLKHHSPTFVSLPHFYKADPYYLSSVDGLKPEKSKHELSFTIEPVTGMVLEVNANLQVNLLIQPVSGSNLFQNVPKVFIPVFWLRQKMKIPDKQIFLLKIVLAVPSICISLGTVMIICSISLPFYKVLLTRRCQPSGTTCAEEAINFCGTGKEISLNFRKYSS